MTKYQMATVLIVEDNAGVRAALNDLLRASGFRTLTARDGASALACLRASHMPMVVLLDVMLPTASGLAVLNAVDADPALARHCAVVVLTAHPKRGAEIADLRARWTASGTPARGAAPAVSASVLSCVLVKPLTLRQLTPAITGAADHLAARSTPDASVYGGASAHEGESQ